eukprot:Lankesteria_metandrocarpae@DN5008_c0_g1_i3.p1
MRDTRDPQEKWEFQERITKDEEEIRTLRGRSGQLPLSRPFEPMLTSRSQGGFPLHGENMQRRSQGSIGSNEIIIDGDAGMPGIVHLELTRLPDGSCRVDVCRGYRGNEEDCKDLFADNGYNLLPSFECADALDTDIPDMIATFANRCLTERNFPVCKRPVASYRGGFPLHGENMQRRSHGRRSHANDEHQILAQSLRRYYELLEVCSVNGMLAGEVRDLIKETSSSRQIGGQSTEVMIRNRNKRYEKLLERCSAAGEPRRVITKFQLEDGITPRQMPTTLNPVRSLRYSGGMRFAGHKLPKIVINNEKIIFEADVQQLGKIFLRLTRLPDGSCRVDTCRRNEEYCNYLFADNGYNLL